MTKEQEEAIDYVQKQIDYFKKQIKFIEAVDRTYYEAEYKLYKNRVKQFETILSMLKEKDKEIERLEKVLEERYLYVPGMRTVYARLMCLEKEDIVKDDLSLRNEIQQHINEKEEKDKIIDLMTEEIKERKYVFTNKTKKEIKQYFESKVKE